MDLFVFICYSNPAKVVVGERNVADGEAKLLESSKGRTVPLNPPASATLGDSGDSINKLFDEGNGVEQERSTETGDDVLEETIATDRLREDFHAATSDIGGKSLATLRGLNPKDSFVFEVNLQARPLVARSSIANAPRVTDVATTTIVVDVSSVSPSRFRVVSRRSAFVGEAKKNVASTSKFVEPTTSFDSFYDIVLHCLPFSPNCVQWTMTSIKFNVGAARQMCLGAESLRQKAIRLREQVSDLEAADAIKGDELRDLKEMNVVFEGEKDLLSERVTTLESVTTLKETEVVSLESERGGLVNQMSSLESASELFKQQIKAMQDEQATALRNRVMVLDAQLLEMAAHLEEDFYPRFLVTISGRQWILTHGLKIILLKCLRSSEYCHALGQAIGCAINKGIQDGLKAGVDHGKAGRDLSVIEAFDPSTKSKYIDVVNALGAVDFSLLTELESKKDASMVDLMDSLYLEGPLAEIPGAEDLQPSSKQLMLPIHRTKDNEKRLSLTDAMVRLVEPLSSRSLTSEASTSAAPATADPITTLSMTFVPFGVVTPLSVPDYQVLDMEPHDGDLSSTA
uniref:Transposase (Putative), gypsy type n=1 Tax=Tanacetum cinerariifolium TaxID=118510 RepID=A0A699GK82_TANCI|nr:hypothetical protein [Tanacetum cinerariifolium]